MLGDGCSRRKISTGRTKENRSRTATTTAINTNKCGQVGISGQTKIRLITTTRILELLVAHNRITLATFTSPMTKSCIDL